MLGIPDEVPEDCFYANGYEPSTRTGALVYACAPGAPGVDHSSAYACAQWLVDYSPVHHVCPLGYPPADRTGCTYWQFYEPDTRTGAVVLLCE